MILLAGLLVAALAGQAPPGVPPSPVAVTARSNPDALVLAAGTAVKMKTLTELSTKQNRQGDRFELAVAEDVLVGGYVAIPRGARGVGEITRLISKGPFGQSGKLETRILYVSVGDARIKLDDRTGDTGDSGLEATPTTVLLGGITLAFITGTSALLPADSLLVSYVDRDLPLRIASAPTAE